MSAVASYSTQRARRSWTSLYTYVYSTIEYFERSVESFISLLEVNELIYDSTVYDNVQTFDLKLSVFLEDTMAAQSW